MIGERARLCYLHASRQTGCVPSESCPKSWRRQRPVKARGSATQRHQIVLWIKRLLVIVISPPMVRHGHTAGGDLDAIDIRLDAHGLEGIRPGHAVTIGVEGDGLIPVGIGGVGHRGGPAPLQVKYTVFDVGLFPAAARHAAVRFEGIMTDQSRITLMQLALPTLENRRGQWCKLRPSRKRPDYP